MIQNITQIFILFVFMRKSLSLQKTKHVSQTVTETSKNYVTGIL